MRSAYAVTHVAHQRCQLEPIERAEPAAGEIAGSTLSSLISPGTEINSAYLARSFPRYSGYAAVFTVESIGAGVEGWRRGDRAFCMGGHRSWQCVPAAEVVPLPDGLEPAVAVLARLMSVSHTTLITTRARPGEGVALTGLGPVGYLAAAQFALAGYRVNASDPDAHRRHIASALPITVLDTLPSDAEAALSIDCSGHEDAVLSCCDATRRGGEVVLVGVPWEQRSQASAHQILHKVFHRYLHLRSGWEWELPRISTHVSQPHSVIGAWRTCRNWLAEGRVPLPGGLIGHWDPRACDAAYQGHLHHNLDHLCTVFDWASLPDESVAASD